MKKVKVCIKNVIEIECPDNWSDPKISGQIRTQANKAANTFVSPDSCSVTDSQMDVNIVAKMDWVHV